MPASGLALSPEHLQAQWWLVLGCVYVPEHDFNMFKG